MIEEPESKSSTGAQGRRIHRRTKQQIPTLFTCGDSSCRKSYGTNAALYTHIKKKHDGIEPEGTERPKNTPKKGKALEEELGKHEIIICKKCQKKQCKCKSEFGLEAINLFQSQNFILFVRYIALFGEDGVREGGVWVRIVDESMQSLSEDDVRQMLQKFCREYEVDLQLNAKQLSYLSFSSRFWDRVNIRQLYQGLFCSLKYNSKKTLSKICQKNGKLKLFMSCLNKHQHEMSIIINLLTKN